MKLRAIRISAIAGIFTLSSLWGCAQVQVSGQGAAEAVYSPGAYKAKFVILVVLDGLRHSEGFGDPSFANIPMLGGRLAPQGALAEQVYNDGDTSTNPSHGALSTGFWQNMDNRGASSPTQPSWLQLWRQASGAQEYEAWVVTSKDKLSVLANCEEPAWKGRALPRQHCGIEGGGLGSGYRDDRATFTVVTRIAHAYGNRAMFVSFKEPDQAAHSGDRQAYLEAIQKTDRLVSELWDWLQTIPLFAGQTDLILTSDHGRHLDGVGSGFKDHGCSCEGCRRVWLLCLGPDFKPGLRSQARVSHIDVAATCAAILGVTIPGSKGRVLHELMQGGARAQLPGLVSSRN